jgi:hypothetical protein
VVAAQTAVVELEPEPVAMEPFSGRFVHETIVESAPARPRFAELAEQPTYAPLPKDYATELHPYSSESARTAVPAALTQSAESDHSDLDVPAFLRRNQF